MKKLRFKNRGGILYFGIDGKFKSSKMAYTQVNKNILLGRYNRGEMDNELSSVKSYFITDLVQLVIDEKDRHLKHKTMLTYRSSFSNHIMPYFVGKMVTEIKPIHIKEFQDKMVDNGLKRESISIARLLLKDAFNISVLSEQITTNPVNVVGMPKIAYKKEKQKPFSLEEIDKILSSTDGQFKNFLGISFFTGMRSGELLALTWDDVDFTTDTITINKTIAGGLINSAKTKASEREIEMIDAAKEFFKNQRLLTGLKKSYVFLSTLGSYHSSNTLFHYYFKKLLTELELENRTLHNTRHTFASIMLNNGVDPLWVSSTLGHENLKITLSVYTHFMPKKEKMSLPFLENRYKNGTEQ